MLMPKRAYYNENVRCYSNGKIERRKIKSKKYKTYTDEWYEVTQTRLTKGGYLQVWVGDRYECWHRAVWVAFNGEIPDGLEVNHKDEIKTNNSLSNLELLTHGDNIRHGTRSKRVAEKLSKPVIGIHIKTGEIVEFPSTREAGRNGFNQGAVAKCCIGRQKTAYGYKWFYKDQISS